MRVGEYVVCIQDDWTALDGATGEDPVLGEVYQVTGLHLFDDEEVLYVSIDLQDDDWFEAHAFRPVSYGPLPARKVREPAQ